tara:strand:+ start:44100 stop:45389 length:1290 start_codon:yes stop_codon:yes gene_type:complete
MVERGEVEDPEHEDIVYTRYILCKNADVIESLINGDMSIFPATKPLFTRNDVAEFASGLLPSAGFGRLRNYREFTSREDYQRTHPDVRIHRQPGKIPLYPFFEASRTPSAAEIQEEISTHSPVAAVLSQAGIDASLIAEALLFHDVCGDDSIVESIRVRPLWMLFLVATNVGESHIRIRSISGEIESSDTTSYRDMNTRIEGSYSGEVTLPGMRLEPDASVIVPLATLIGPLEEAEFDQTWTENKDTPRGRVQRLRHGSMKDVRRNIGLVGPAIFPQSLVLEVSGKKAIQPLHEFDLSNMYLLDYYFEAGCCPHVFFADKAGALSYAGQIWAYAPNLVQVHVLNVPEKVVSVLVAEIEDEVSYLQCVRVNGSSVPCVGKIERGETVRIDVEAGDVLELEGFYSPNSEQSVKDPFVKNMFISEYLATTSC